MICVLALSPFVISARPSGASAIDGQDASGENWLQSDFDISSLKFLIVFLNHTCFITINFESSFPNVFLSDTMPKLRRQATPYRSLQPGNPLDPDYELLLNEYQRIRGPHSLFVGTWNVANGPFAASEPLQDWLPPNMVRSNLS
jgi:hypothetical protein